MYDVHIPYINASREFYPKKYEGILFGVGWDLSPKLTKVLFPVQEPIIIGKEMPNGSIVTNDDIEYIKASYDSGIKYTDAQLMEFFNSIKDKPFFNNTIL